MLSAVEGIALIPGLENISQMTLMIIAGGIAVILFSLQAQGSERVAWAFGPVMVIWFAVLAGAGLRCDMVRAAGPACDQSRCTVSCT